MALDRFFDDGRTQTANVAVSASPVSENIMYDVIFIFSEKRLLYIRHFTLDERAETNVSDQRGRENTAELLASLAKRSETSRGGVKG